MKKTVLVFISLLVLAGCNSTAKDKAGAGTVKESVRIEIAALSPTPSMAPSETPWPYPSDEHIFVPAVTTASTAEPPAASTAAPAAEPSAQPAEAPTVREPYAVEDGVETVAWLSDTQHYANIAANKLPDIYPVMTGFLRDKAEEMNLVYVVHTGDLVHVNNSEENWRVAREAMDLLNGIPTGVLAGNHDMNPDKGGYKNYWKYFGKKQYDRQVCYGESFEDNRGHYDLVTVCRRDYIFVSP